VWVTYSTGMLASVELWRDLDLSTVATFPGADGPEVTNSTTSSVDGGVLWVTNGGGSILCADSRTGRLLATDLFQAQAPVLSHGNELFAPASGGLDVLKPPEACHE
jgi:hypothetical protein